ncbi:hypothetical protein WMF30_40220 [Sorangium sp. So ce134]
MLALLLILLIVGPCASDDGEELFCEGAGCDSLDDLAGVGGTGGAGGAGGSAASVVVSSSAESSVSSGGAGAEGGGGPASTSSATTASSSTSATTTTSSTGGPVGPACGSDAACRHHTEGCYPPYCHECLEGRCVEGHCELHEINDDVWGCIVTDVESPRLGKEGRCGGGTCLDFTPVRCETDEGTFQGCDGTEHPSSEYVEIGFDPGPNQAEVECTGSSRQVEYCPPGTFCVVRFAYDPVAGVERSIGGRCL